MTCRRIKRRAVFGFMPACCGRFVTPRHKMNWDRSNCGIAQFEPQSLHSLVARYLRVRVKIMSNEAHPMKDGAYAFSGERQFRFAEGWP